MPAEQRRIRALVTPEGVPLPLELADAGQRAGAFVIDMLVLAGAFILLGLLMLVFRLVGLVASPQAGAIGLVATQLGGFFLRNLYFTWLESRPRGATIGKRAMGLRVIARHGGRLTLDAVIARNAMREVEIYLPLSFLAINAGEGGATTLMVIAGFGWSGLFLFLPLLNRDRLRAGDLLAGTWVIRSPRRKLLPDLADAATPDDHFTDAELDAYGVYELETLERVIRDLQPQSIETVAEAIRIRIGRRWSSDGGGDRDLAFLQAYYAALRRRLEGRLIFGERRRDKHDPR